MHEMNISRPDLNLLVVFDAIARSGSVTGAAERLALSQPAVSHALNRLRDVIGDPLFMRAKSGLAPTPRAQAMTAEVGRILDAAGSVLAKASFDPGTTQRRFRLGASDYSSVALAPRIAREFCSAAPRATLDVLPAGVHTLPQLESGEMDCSFWAVEPPPAPWLSKILYRERLIGVMCRTHPLSADLSARAPSLAAYLAYPHAVVSLRDPSANPVDSALRKLGLNRRVAIVTQSFAAVLAAMPGSRLLASLPEKLAPAARLAGLVTYELPLELPDFAYSLIWRSRTDVDPAMVWFRRLIVDVVVAGTGGAGC